MVNPSEGSESRSHLWRAGTACVLTHVIVRGNRSHIQSTLTHPVAWETSLKAAAEESIEMELSCRLFWIW